MKKIILIVAMCVLAFGESNLQYYEYADDLTQQQKNHIEQNKDFYSKGFLEDMNLKIGKRVYTAACENCHGVNGDKNLTKNLKEYDEESLYAIIKDYMYDVGDNNNISSTTSIKQALLEGYSSMDIKNMIAYIELKEYE
ncbi:hypothetical protein CCY99_04575 [Helicobacter sp. 16-1353]|uniref:c-type cytochrome n=1 Tax=Helicobacter sp. 16-1353 TaxID=2004996 RepID=UPI000DCC6403|nr:c-type cytochrome [Helicobacter sp. 16-1353]RAX54291.1 hypothetical protein CCY99_04575 [Helicobacter sp. 16-1353]